jgi:hypothetical protein
VRAVERRRRVKNRGRRPGETRWRTFFGVVVTIGVWGSFPGPFILFRPILLAAAVGVAANFMHWGTRTAVISTAVLAAVLVLANALFWDHAGRGHLVIVAIFDALILGLTFAAWRGGLFIARRTPRERDKKPDPYF